MLEEATEEEAVNDDVSTKRLTSADAMLEDVVAVKFDMVAEDEVS